MGLFVGLDIGGTKLMVAAAGADGEILRRAHRPTPTPLADGLDTLHEMIAEVVGGEPIVAIGAAIGGPLDHRAGVVSPLHQPAWRDVPLRQIMEDRWGCPLRVDVDTNIAAVGERRFGGATASRLLYITLSTGMGGGFLIDGRIYRGAAGAHPEIGHQAIAFRCANPDGVACECGASDCLEALISGNAIRRIYGVPAEDLDEPGWTEVAYNLGQGLRNLATIYAPDLIVLGGGIIIGRGEGLLAPARETMAAGLRLVPPPEVRLSGLGYDTAMYGAIAVAIDGPS